MLTLTPDAQSVIRSLVNGDPASPAGIRIAATPPVDSQGAQLDLEITPVPQDGDQVIDDDGARVFLDETAATLLDHETLDVQVDQEAQELNFYLA